MLELSVAGFVDSAVDCKGLAALDMAFGRIEVRVAGNNVTFFDKRAEKYVLGCAALVRGDNYGETGDTLHCITHVEE